MPPINEIICGHNVEVLATFPDEYVDLTVTSPPYDNLRKYKGYTFDFEGLARQLYRVTKVGGVVVWVVADETKNFCESLSSFKQAIYFVEQCGFNLLDTMFYQKTSYAPAYPNLKRYAPVVEYMFVFTKGSPKTFNPQIEQKSNASISKYSMSSFRNKDKIVKNNNVDRSNKLKTRTNIWYYSPGNDSDRLKFAHPATYPEKLAEDHILSWSNPDDIVLDPMCGSGTTCKMAIKHSRRYIGIDCSQEYVDLSRQRISNVQMALT